MAHAPPPCPPSLLAEKRVLLVSNRCDPPLERRLVKTLAIELSCVRSGRQRRLHAIRERILQGRYDIVLVATGFVGHQVDNILKPACKRMRVPYLDVKKGKYGACLRALRIRF